MSSATTPIRLKVAADLGVTAGTIGLGNVENKSSAQIRAEIVAADLAGAGKAFSVLPASGATVGATIGVNFTGQFTTANIANFFAAKVITAGIIDVTDLFAQAISVTDTVKVGSDTGRYLLTLDGRGTASPIAIIDKNNAGALVFGFDSDDKPYFGGGLRDGAIDSVNVFTDEVLTQLKPIVVGSTGGIFKVAGLPSMIGATLNKTVTVTPANPSSVLIGLSFSDYFLNIASSVNLNFTPPKYMVTITRSLNGGTATTIHSQMYTGTALNQRDPEVNKWECSFAINVDLAISDINHAANNNDSITYTFTVTRSSGSYSAAKITAASCSQQTQGGGTAGVASQLTAPYVGLTATGSTEYPAMEIKNSPTTASTWVRTPSLGLLPYASGGASALGTSSWPFNTIYGKAIYDNNNRVYSASNPNIGTGSANYAAGNHGHAFGALTGVPETATRWPTAIEAGTAPIAGDSTAQNGYLNLIASNYALGVCLYPDIDFSTGSNSVFPYNNSGGSGVVHTRQADASAPNSSKQVIKISHNPALAISPGFGGFITNMSSAANKIFVQVFVAKLPVGRYFVTTENSMGTNSKTYWATSNNGTGKWERYIRITMCGDSGSFSSGGHTYVGGGSATAFDTYLAECTVYELTSVALPYNKYNKPSPADIGAQPAGSYAPLTGGGTSGTWGISVTGNAATATVLQTARTINGVSFNGSANITVYDPTKFENLAGTITSNDWNTILNQGAYAVGNMTGVNKPAGYNYGMVLNFSSSGATAGVKTQVYFPHNVSDNGLDPDLYLPRYRSGYNSDFGKWKALASTDWVSLNFLSSLGGAVSGQASFSAAYANTTNTAHIFHNANGTTGVEANIRSMRESGGATWLWEKVANGALRYSTGINGAGTNTITLQVSDGTVNANKFSINGNAGYFHGDSNYTQFSGSNFYITTSVPITYIYSPSIYLGNTSGTTVLLRGNTLGGTGWNISGTGTITGTSIVGPLTGNATTATTLQTARTIAISGAVTGTATSFNGGANITIAATALNASNLSAGTVPDARISGSYTGLANLTGSGTVDFAKFLGNAGDTVAAPSFSWTGDLDTGMYWVAADQIGIATGGVSRGVFDSAGLDSLRVRTTGTGNDYNSGGVEIRGNGTTDTVYPTLGFHQPNKYGASIQLRGVSDFRFYAQGAAAYANVTAGNVVANGTVHANGGLVQNGNVILNGSDTWLRTTGATGWHSATYGGGMYMSDTTWVRTYGGKKFFVENSSEDAIYTSGGVTSLGPMKAKSWGTGNVGAKVMTWDDFLPANPPAGLQGVITANWIAAGVINARHLQVDSVVNDGGVYTSFKLQPEAVVPLRLSTVTSTGALVEDIFSVDRAGNGFFKGLLSKDTVDINSIQEEARRQINPYYLGTTYGNKQENTTYTGMANGASFSLPAISTGGGVCNLSFKFATGDYKVYGSIPPLPANPEWKIEVFRGTTAGTLVFTKNYTGSVSRTHEPEIGTWDLKSSISIEGSFSDSGAAASQVYVVKVTYVAGSLTTLYRRYFGGESPNFLTNSLVKATNGYWKDKETGFIIQWGSLTMTANQATTVTLPIAFPNAISIALADNMENYNASSPTHVYSKSKTSISLINSPDSTTTVQWMAYGY